MKISPYFVYQKILKMRKTLIFLLLLFIISSISAQKRKIIPPEKPKLIIGIVVEQMRYDVLYRFWDQFGYGGFKRIINKGTNCKQAYYNYLITQSSVGYATIACGTSPTYHGIVANEWYMRMQEKDMYCVADEKVPPDFFLLDAEKRSPKNLLTTTYSDELKLYNNNKSKVFGVALHDYAAILSAGHTGDAAIWFNSEKGQWISNKYYYDSIPKWLNEFNQKHYEQLYLDRVWQTKYPLKRYLYSDSTKYGTGINNQYFFPYDLSKIVKKEKNYKLLFKTPFGNSFTKDIAIATILNNDLGKDDYTDVITIGFSSTAGVYSTFGPNSVEIEDAYLRLDEELEHFLNFIDEYIGKEQVLVYLTSDHGSVPVPEYLKEQKIPSGYFNYKRATLLLKSYMNLIYGKGDWISKYYKQQIYLNQLLIEDSKLSLSEVQNTVAQFLIQFSGVANTITATTLQNTDYTSGIYAKLQNSYNQKRSGDVIINLEPGWVEEKSILESENDPYSFETHVPLIWYGWKINRTVIHRNIDIRDIAPTITYFLEVGEPNGTSGKLIYELVK